MRSNTTKSRGKSRAAKPASNIATTDGDAGVIKIHENVIATIVRKATCAVDGVIRLAGSAIVDNIAEIVGSRKMHDRAISVEISESDVKIEVKVKLVYGAHVPSVAAEIQNAIMEQVESITGMTVSQVNVVIDALEESDDEVDDES